MTPSGECVIRVRGVGPAFWHNARQVLMWCRDELPEGEDVEVDAGLLTHLIDADVEEAADVA